MLKTIAFSFIAICIAYFLFYPLLRNMAGGRSFFKWFMILYIIAVIVSSITTYFF